MSKLDNSIAEFKAREQIIRDRAAAAHSLLSNLRQHVQQIAPDLIRHGMRLSLDSNTLHLAWNGGPPITTVAIETRDHFLDVKSKGRTLQMFDPLSISASYTAIHAVEDWLSLAIAELAPTKPPT